MMDTLIDLAINFWKIGTFSIGGGYAIIALIEDLLVDQYHWLSLKEYTDIITISQMTPGPLAINASSFTGLKVAGFLGAIVATVSCVISGFVISLVCYVFFNHHRDNNTVMTVLRGLKSIATGLIGSAGSGILLLALTGHNKLSFTVAQFDIWAFFIAVGSFILLRRFKIGPVWIMLISAVVGLAVYA